MLATLCIILKCSSIVSAHGVFGRLWLSCSTLSARLMPAGAGRASRSGWGFREQCQEKLHSWQCAAGGAGPRSTSWLPNRSALRCGSTAQALLTLCAWTQGARASVCINITSSVAAQHPCKHACSASGSGHPTRPSDLGQSLAAPGRQNELFAVMHDYLYHHARHWRSLQGL